MTGQNQPTGIIAESDRNIVLNTSPPSTSSKSPTRNEASLAPGTYELTGELIWGKVDKKKQSFNLTVTIPSGTIRKK